MSRKSRASVRWSGPAIWTTGGAAGCRIRKNPRAVCQGRDDRPRRGLRAGRFQPRSRPDGGRVRPGDRQRPAAGNAGQGAGEDPRDGSGAADHPAPGARRTASALPGPSTLSLRSIWSTRFRTRPDFTSKWLHCWGKEDICWWWNRPSTSRRRNSPLHWTSPERPGWPPNPARGCCSQERHCLPVHDDRPPGTGMMDAGEVKAEIR